MVNAGRLTYGPNNDGSRSLMGIWSICLQCRGGLEHPPVSFLHDMKWGRAHLQFMQRQEVGEKLKRRLVYAADARDFRDLGTAYQRFLQFGHGMGARLAVTRIDQAARNNDDACHRAEVPRVAASLPKGGESHVIPDQQITCDFSGQR
jgi:hypothetical protein